MHYRRENPGYAIGIERIAYVNVHSGVIVRWCVRWNFRAWHLLGPYVTMVYRMLQRDCLRFLLIYVVFMAGFTHGKHAVCAF